MLDSIKLTSKNQVTIPAKVARELDLSAGDRLTYTVVDKTIVLKPQPTVAERLASLHAITSKLNKGVASDESIKQTMVDYYRSRTKRP